MADSAKDRVLDWSGPAITVAGGALMAAMGYFIRWIFTAWFAQWTSVLDKRYVSRHEYDELQRTTNTLQKKLDYSRRHPHAHHEDEQ